MANTTVPFPPYKVAVLDQNGFVSKTWADWFREVYQRIGGKVAPPNSDFSGSMGDLAATVSTLSGTVSSLSSQVTALANELGQGREL